MEEREGWCNWSPFAKSYDPLKSGSIDGTDTVPHDRALVRALTAKYIPPHSHVATPDAARTLFVGRLDLSTTEEIIKYEFSQYGTVTHCRLVRDVVTGLSRGYAFVQFKRREDAERSRRDALHTTLDGREIFVDWENARTMPNWIPRRLGGGFGGKKESGQLRFGGRDRPFRKPIIIQPVRREVKSESAPNQKIKQSPSDKNWERLGEREPLKKPSRVAEISDPHAEVTDDGKSTSTLYNSQMKKHSGRDTESLGDTSDGRRDHGRRSKSSRGEGNTQEWDDSYHQKPDRERKYKYSRDRGNTERRDDSYEWRSDRYSKKHYRKSSRDRADIEEWEDSDWSNKDDRKRSDKYSRSRDAGEQDCSYEGRSKRSRKSSRDRGDDTNYDDSYERRQGQDGKRRKSSRDHEDVEEWDDSNKNRPSKSSRDQDEDQEWDKSLERRSAQDQNRKYSKKLSRSREDSEEDDDSCDQTSDRERKRSDKSSRERAETKGKKKHKKSKKSHKSKRHKSERAKSSSD